ncbi:MAG: amidohydrolase family protein [Candidatus Bathyarchaeia archaeon]
MIVDSHVHICEPPHNGSRLSRKNIDGSRVQWSDTRGDAAVGRLIEAMDGNGIDRALIMGLEGIVSNEYLGEVVAADPRLTGFAWVEDPKRPEAVGELETAVLDHGLSGLKLHPGLHSFSPSQPEVVPLIRRAAELGVPVLIHCYPFPPGHYENNLPHHIDSLKKAVPEATIIVGHMGQVNYHDMLALVRHPGLVVETSWGLTLLAELNGLDYAARFLRRLGVEKAVYGSDWFGPNGEMERQLGLIERLDLTRAEKDLILGGNISRVMSL